MEIAFIMRIPPGGEKDRTERPRETGVRHAAVEVENAPTVPWASARDTEEQPTGLPALVRRPVYMVRLQVFEGPLDLLLHLIRMQELDIYDIRIAEITGQYLEYLGFMESLDLALAGEFLEMAATLIRIKVQMLLPCTPEETEEEDPRQELVRKLVEYKKFKEAAQRLCAYEEVRRDYFPRGVDPKTYAETTDDCGPEEALRDVTLFHLVDALREVLSRVPARIDVHGIDIEAVTIEERMHWLREFIGEHGPTTFSELFSTATTRSEIVATFIALLELMRGGTLTAVQERLFGEIRIELKTGKPGQSAGH